MPSRQGERAQGAIIANKGCHLGSLSFPCLKAWVAGQHHCKCNKGCRSEGDARSGSLLAGPRTPSAVHLPVRRRQTGASPATAPTVHLPKPLESQELPSPHLPLLLHWASTPSGTGQGGTIARSQMAARRCCFSGQNMCCTS